MHPERWSPSKTKIIVVLVVFVAFLLAFCFVPASARIIKEARVGQRDITLALSLFLALLSSLERRRDKEREEEESERERERERERES